MAQIGFSTPRFEFAEFNGDNVNEVVEVLRMQTEVPDQDPVILVGAEDSDPDLRIAGKRYFRWDFDGNAEHPVGSAGYIPPAHIVEGDFVVYQTGPAPAARALRYYPEQFHEVFGG